MKNQIHYRNKYQHPIQLLQILIDIIMNLKQKPFYFFTDRQTLYQYFVDNRNQNPSKHIYYPKQYETMSDKQINKYKTSLVKNFLWWSIWNKQKMNSVDWQITTRKVMDIMGLLGLAVVLGRAMRGFLFKFEFITIQNFLQTYNMKVEFWKSLTAYSTCLYLAYRQVGISLDQIYLRDMAFEYKYNFKNDLNGTGIDELISGLCEDRFNKKQQQQEIKQKQKQQVKQESKQKKQ